MLPKVNSLIPFHEIEEAAYSQIMNVINLDCLKTLAIMPDVHAGYDMCIGGVALLDGYISPSFIGYDLGCGMTFVNTEAKVEDVFDGDERLLFDDIYKAIPVGFSVREAPLDYEDFKSAGDFKDLDKRVAARLHLSLGTLGGGNHFIEIGSNTDNEVCITIHSGSRNIGHSIGSKYMKLGRMFKIDSDLGKAYLEDMTFALEFALANRLCMMKSVANLMGFRWTNKLKDTLINENHNHAIVTEDGILHRKGATPADKDQLGVIPANMRDGVYVTKGLGNKEFLSSASHGAGRVYSRRKAKEEIPLELFEQTMKENNIIAKVERSTLDESPFAYKDIDTVIGYQEGIVLNVIDKIKPIINIKA